MSSISLSISQTLSRSLPPLLLDFPSPAFGAFDTITDLIQNENTPFYTSTRRVQHLFDSLGPSSKRCLQSLCDRGSAFELSFDRLNGEQKSKSKIGERRYTWTAEIKDPEEDGVDRKYKWTTEIKEGKKKGHLEKNYKYTAEIKAKDEDSPFSRKYTFTASTGDAGDSRGSKSCSSHKEKEKEKKDVKNEKDKKKLVGSARLVEIEDHPSDHGSLLLRQAFARRVEKLRGKRKELSPQDAAMKIQLFFKAYLLRRSKALRALRELAIAKSKLKEIRALFNNFSYRRRLTLDAEERQRFSEKIIVLLLTVDAIEGTDMLVRSAKRSLVDELEAMLDVVDPHPAGRSLSMKRTFDMPDPYIQKEFAASVAKVVRMLHEEAHGDVYKRKVLYQFEPRFCSKCNKLGLVTDECDKPRSRPLNPKLRNNYNQEAQNNKKEISEASTSYEMVLQNGGIGNSNSYGRQAKYWETLLKKNVHVEPTTEVHISANSLMPVGVVLADTLAREYTHNIWELAHHPTADVAWAREASQVLAHGTSEKTCKPQLMETTTSEKLVHYVQEDPAGMAELSARDVLWAVEEQARELALAADKVVQEEEAPAEELGQAVKVSEVLRQLPTFPAKESGKAATVPEGPAGCLSHGVEVEAGSQFQPLPVDDDVLKIDVGDRESSGKGKTPLVEDESPLASNRTVMDFDDMVDSIERAFYEKRKGKNKRKNKKMGENEASASYAMVLQNGGIGNSNSYGRQAQYSEALLKKNVHVEPTAEVHISANSLMPVGVVLADTLAREYTHNIGKLAHHPTADVHYVQEDPAGMAELSAADLLWAVASDKVVQEEEVPAEELGRAVKVSAEVLWQLPTVPAKESGKAATVPEGPGSCLSHGVEKEAGSQFQPLPVDDYVLKIEVGDRGPSGKGKTPLVEEESPLASNRTVMDFEDIVDSIERAFYEKRKGKNKRKNKKNGEKTNAS